MNFLDELIAEALRCERVPVRFVMTSTTMAGLIEDEPLFERVHVHGQPGEFQPSFIAAHPELFPLHDIDGRVAREITRAGILALRAAVKAAGISHYRRIPIVIDDTQTAFRLDAPYWGDPAVAPAVVPERAPRAHRPACQPASESGTAHSSEGHGPSMV